MLACPSEKRPWRKEREGVASSSSEAAAEAAASPRCLFGVTHGVVDDAAAAMAAKVLSLAWTGPVGSERQQRGNTSEGGPGKGSYGVLL